MIIPLDLLIGTNTNMYVLTNAIIKRASQLHMAGDQELEENRGNIVSTAVKQILTEKVKYHLED